MFLYYLCCSVVEMSVKNTDDIWFINFYSPRCSHCHELAPTVSVLVHLLCIITLHVFYSDMLYRERFGVCVAHSGERWRRSSKASSESVPSTAATTACCAGTRASPDIHRLKFIPG